MSVFEIVMLSCFGISWPISVYKSWKSKSTAGKSPLFMGIILFGYVAGIIHKAFYSFDMVIYLYLLNFVIISADLGLYVYNRSKELSAERAATKEKAVAKEKVTTRRRVLSPKRAIAKEIGETKKANNKKHKPNKKLVNVS